MSVKKLLALTCAALLISSAPVFAKTGTESGGGGDVVTLPDGRTVLADAFLDHGSLQPNNMPSRRTINPRILQTVGLYLRAIESQLNNEYFVGGSSDIAKLLENLKNNNSDLLFYGVQTVEELNDHCASGGKKAYALSGNYKVNQVACTSGVSTFIVEPTFIKLNLKDQALLLIHERLTTLVDKLGSKNYSAIARFTTGLGLYVDLYTEQSANNYRDLTPKETTILANLYTAIEEIERRNRGSHSDSFQWTAHSRGGGRIHKRSQVDPTATIDLGSVVQRNTRVGANAQIIKSFVASVQNSNIQIGEDVKILSSVVWTSNQIRLQDNAKVVNSDIRAKSVDFSSGVTVSSSALNDLGNFTVGSNTEITGSQITFSDFDDDIKIAANQNLIDGEINGDSALYYEAEINVSPIIFNIKVAQNFEATEKSEMTTGKNVVDKKQLILTLGLNLYSEEVQANAVTTTSDVRLLNENLERTGTQFGCLVLCGTYEKRYTYSVSQLSFNVNIQPERSQNESLYVITKDGIISKAGYKKKIYLRPKTKLAKKTIDVLANELNKRGVDMRMAESFGGIFAITFPVVNQ